MGLRKRLVVAAAAVTLGAAVPSSALAYTYLGACQNNTVVGQTTWDLSRPFQSSVDGVQMTQYQIPGSSTWATCTYTGVGYGHMDELLSLQGAGIVQVGIAKYTGSAGTSWMFIYTPQDNSSGAVYQATWFSETPVAGRTYVFGILRVAGSPVWDWKISINDINTGVTGYTYIPSNWATAGDEWYGGETANANDTMGRYTQIASFDTYQIKTHTSSGWGSYLSQATIDGSTYKYGTNGSIVQKTGLTIGGVGGFYVWTP